MTKRKKTLIELLLDAGFTPEKWSDKYPFAAQDDVASIYFFSGKPRYYHDNECWYGDWDGDFKIKSITELCKNQKRTIITKQQFIDAYNEKHSITENKTEWPEESRIDSIGQNGATGEHYPQDNGLMDDALGDEYDLSITDKYLALSDVLGRAFEQASIGKGNERHAQDLPFTEQPMQLIQRLVGKGFATGQAIKKIQESDRLPHDAAIRELLGAINYIAGAIIFMEQSK